MTVATGLECLRCGTGYPPEEIVTGCSACREQGFAVNLRPTYSQEAFRTVREGRGFDPEERGVWRYHALLPVGLEHAVWLGEGETPLIHATTLGGQLGLDFLYLKNEARNPTGSFKDRMAAVVVARAKAAGARTVTISSSGNAGAALAAYAAVAGLRCVVFTTARAPLSMKAQMLAYGARLFATPTGPDRWTLMGQAVEKYGWHCASNYLQPPVGSNPYGVEGYKTIAFEVWEQMGREAPDVMAFPVSNGDGLAGTMRGFGELAELGFIGRAPRPVAGELFGPLTRAQAESLEAPAPVETAPSAAISIGGQGTFQALNTLYENDGRAVTVEDAELLHWQSELAKTEGVYAEVSSLASVAALARLRKDDRLRRGAACVALITATGLKDPGAGGVADNVPVVQPTLDELERAMRETYGVEAGEL